MILSNIDSFMNTFLSMLWTGITTVWNTMQNIEFGGTNYLAVMVTITILGVAIPILLSLAQNSVRVEKARKVEKHDK